MKERTRVAFEFASAVLKQIITLSTGIIVLTISFVKDLLGSSPGIYVKYVMGFAWVLYFVAIICGVLALMAITGTIAPKTKSVRPPTIWEPSIVLYSNCQVFSFLLATAAVIVFGLVGLL